MAGFLALYGYLPAVEAGGATEAAQRARRAFLYWTADTERERTRYQSGLFPLASAAQEAESNAEGRQRRRDSGEQQRGGSSSTDGEHQAGGWGLKGTVMKSGVLCGGYEPAGAVVL